MTRPTFLLLGIMGVFELAHQAFGYTVVYRVGYGAFAILALIIALSFLWLWWQRSTPLALGMAFGWAGAASVIAWWWVFNLLDKPDWIRDSSLLFVFLSVYFVGALMHLEVIGRSFGYSRRAACLPVLASLALSVTVAVLL